MNKTIVTKWTRGERSSVVARGLALICVAMLLTFCGCERDDNNGGLGGDPSPDNIDNVTFDAVVTVTYNSSTCAVSMEPVSQELQYTSSGCHVTVKYSGSDNVKYVLKGSSDNGSFKLYSGHKQAIVLDGVTLTNPNGAAINVQGPEATPGKGKRTFVVVNGTNTLTDGTVYSNTPASEDEKGVIFGEGQLVFSGGGTLNITAQGKSGIASDDYVHFMESPTVNIVSTAGHGVKAKDFITVSDGTLNINVSADTKKGLNAGSHVYYNGGSTTITITGDAAYDSESGEYKGSAGVKADSSFYMLGGVLMVINNGKGGKGISCNGDAVFQSGQVNVSALGSDYSSGSIDVLSKGIKCDGDILLSGSKINVVAVNKAIETEASFTISGGKVFCNASNADAMSAGGDMDITGGTLCAVSNFYGDAIDADGNFTMSGGLVYAIASPDEGDKAIDVASSGKLTVKGGVLIALGDLESGATLTQDCWSPSSWNPQTWYGMTVGTDVYAFFTHESNGKTMVVSGATKPELRFGVTATDGNVCIENWLLSGCTSSGGVEVPLTQYNSKGLGR